MPFFEPPVSPDDPREVQAGAALHGVVELRSGEILPWATSSSIAALQQIPTVVLADADTDQVVFFDADTLEEMGRADVGDWPEQLLVGPDDTLYVSCRGSRTVDVIPPGGRHVSRSIIVGAEPIGMAMSPDGSVLYVANSTSNSVVALDATLGEPLWEHAFDDQPVGLYAHPRGDMLYITQLYSEALTVVDAGSGALLAEPGYNGFDRTQAELAAVGNLDDVRNHLRAAPAVPMDNIQVQGFGRGFAGAAPKERRPSMARGIALSPSGLRVFVPHALADTGEHETLSMFGGDGAYGGSSGAGPISGGMSVFDGESARLLRPAMAPSDGGRALVKTVAEGRLMGAVAHHPTHSMLFVASQGTDEVFVMNSRGVEPHTRPLLTIPVTDGPRGLLVSADGKDLYVHTAFARKVERYRIDPKTGPNVHASVVANLGPDAMPEMLARGRSLFYSVDNRISSTGLTCGSCHPSGRQDKRVWHLNLGPRQTPQLAGRLEGTAPYNWLGSEDELEDNIENTVFRLNGFGLPDEDRDALAAFIREGLTPPDNPHRTAGGTLTAQQFNGKLVFESEGTGCSGCHQPGEQYADAYRYDVGTTSDREHEMWKRQGMLEKDPAMGEFKMGLLERMGGVVTAASGPVPTPPIYYDTPSLFSLFDTAPYLHDGSVTDLQTLLAEWNRGDHMGSTSHLEDDELDALVAYLKTL